MSLTASDDVITSSVVSSDVIASLVIADDAVYAEKENAKLVTSSANVVMTSARNSDAVISLSSFDDVRKPDVKKKLVRQVAKQISTSSNEEGITKQMSSESAPLSRRRISRGSSTSSLKLKTSISDNGNFFTLASSNRVSMTSSFTDSSSSREQLDVEKVRVVPGRETLIELNKGSNGLGISIVGGRDSLLNCILVHTVYQEGAAAIDGRLWPGDRILAVNGQDISNSTHDEAIDVLWKTSGRVSLLIIRDENREQIEKEEDEDVYDVHTVSLFKQPNKGLGLSIIARRNHPGVYISNLIPGGVAKKEGSLKKGDHILSINGNDVKFASQETVASILKNVRDEVVIRVGRLKGGLLPPELTEVVPKMLLNQPDVNLKNEEPMLSYTSKDREENQIRFVEIHKSKSQPLGITIAGGLNSPLGDVPIFIVMIQQRGAAASHLKIGDVILSVNGRSTDNKTHDEVVTMLKGTDDTIVLMQVMTSSLHRVFYRVC